MTRRPVRTGTAATELALALPILVFVLFGGVDLARYAGHAMMLSNAVRVAADAAATEQVTEHTWALWEEDVLSAFEEEVSGAGLLEPRIESIELYGDGVRRRVEVRGRCVFETCVDWPGIPPRIEVVRAVHARHLR